jgi:hypothetical protein
MPLWWWTPFATKIKGRASSIAANIAKLPELLRRPQY